MGPWPMLVFGSVAVVMFYGMVIWPNLRDRKRHTNLLKTLKKNDRVVTSGGIIGQFVSADGVEVTLKVDDNTRIKFHRNYIVGVLADEKKESK